MHNEFRFFVTNFCVHDATPIVFGVTADGATVGVRAVRMPYAVYVDSSYSDADAAKESKVRQWFDARVRPLLEARNLHSTHFRPAMQLVLRSKLVGHSATQRWMGRVLYDSPDACRQGAAELRNRLWCRTYHHGLDPSLTFTATTGVRCFAWATCVNPTEATRRFTSCDVEMVCDVKRVRPTFTETDDTPSPPPPLRIASFDIETDGLHWDQGHELRMIGISCEGRDILLTRHSLAEVSAPDYCVVTCGDERGLVQAFVTTLHELRPVFLTGWNIFGFDLQFLFERAKHLGLMPTMQRLSWLPCKPLRPAVKEMSSNAFGQNKIYHDDIQGLITLDGYILARKSLKMPSYSLKAFGEWIGNAKGDVTYEEMVEAFTTQDRGKLREVADYCMQDARLVPLILKRMEEPDKVMAMTRLAAVPPVYTIKRGQSILTYGLIVAEAFARDLVINPPARRRAGNGGSGGDGGGGGSGGNGNDDDDGEGYQGATVIEPTRGYHRDPVAVLDFESLYPSIMLAYNMCVSTLIQVYTSGDTVPAEYVFPRYSAIDIGNGTTAVFRREGGDGVVPSILRTLLARRKAVKKGLAGLAPGSVEYNQANAKQLALKVACNSVYGYFGASTSQLYEKALAAAVTSMGRQSLFKVQNVIGDMCLAGTVPPETHVVYGDSVTGDTPLLLRFALSGQVVLRPIEALGGRWRRYHGDKEAFEPETLVEVWQDGGFTPVKKVIRHVVGKRLFRVMTLAGFVDCTADHSLLLSNKQKVSPLTLQMGDLLLTSEMGSRAMNAVFPGVAAATMTREAAFEMGVYEKDVSDALLQAPLDVLAAYWEGFSCTGTFTATSKLQAAALYVVAQRLGHEVQVSCGHGQGNDNLFALTLVTQEEGGGKTRARARATLTGVIPLPALEQGQFVYDLETESHHFGVGPGSLVVHNTDSVMVKFPGQDPANAAALAKLIETECTQAFPEPMRLEFENLFATYMLLTKKRYGGKTWTEGGASKVVIKGLSTQRRDFPKIVQEGIRGVLDILLEGQGTDAPSLALDFLENALRGIATNAVALEELSITKELNKSHYKTPPPHLVVARKMKARNPHDPPKPGDRIRFVVLYGKGNVSERAEEFEFVRDHMKDAKPDLEYYADQLCSQCEDLLRLSGQGLKFETVRHKYVTMAKLHCEGQPKLSRFFRVTTAVAASFAAPGAKRAPTAAEIESESGASAAAPSKTQAPRKQASLDTWFRKKNKKTA